MRTAHLPTSEDEGPKVKWLMKWVESRIIAHAQAAVAVAEDLFGGVDVLFCCDGEGMSSLHPILHQPWHLLPLYYETMYRNKQAD